MDDILSAISSCCSGISFQFVSHVPNGMDLAIFTMQMMLCATGSFPDVRASVSREGRTGGGFRMTASTPIGDANWCAVEDPEYRTYVVFYDATRSSPVAQLAQHNTKTTKSTPTLSIDLLCFTCSLVICKLRWAAHLP